VQEQSHKSEMGAAVRADFERLRARREGGVMVAPEPLRPVVEPASEPVVAAAALEPEPAEVEVPVETPAGGPRRSWLGRPRDRL
jgi:hypothetical protein